VAVGEVTRDMRRPAALRRRKAPIGPGIVQPHATAAYVLVGEGLTTGVAMFSYNHKVTFEVTGDLDASPDVAVLAEGIAAGVDQLIACL